MSKGPTKLNRIVGEGYVPDFEATPVFDCTEECYSCPETKVCALAIRKMILIYNEVITRRISMDQANDKIRKELGAKVFEKRLYPHWREIIGPEEEKFVRPAIKAIQGKDPGPKKEAAWDKLGEGTRTSTASFLKHCIYNQWFAPIVTPDDKLLFRRPMRAFEAKPSDLAGTGTTTISRQSDPDFIPEVDDEIIQGDLGFFEEVR